MGVRNYEGINESHDPRPAAATVVLSLAGDGGGRAANALWSTSSSWTGNLPPAAGDNAYLFQTAGANFTAQFNISSNPSFNNLRVGGVAGGTSRSFTLLHNNNVTMSFANESIGYDGLGIFTQGSDSSPINSISGNLYLGELSTGHGTYNLQTGTMTASNVYLGGSASDAGGTGLVNITGGRMNVGTLKIWRGLLTIDGGALQGDSIIASNWNLLSFIDGSVTLTSSSANSGSLSLGSSSNAATLILSGGTQTCLHPGQKNRSNR